MSKRYKIGMYGGKFIPFHKGHKYCLSVASLECDTVYCIMFINGADEERLNLTESDKRRRMRIFADAVKGYGNVIPAVIDVSKCRDGNGNEDWDAETPLVRDCVGGWIDAVYASEPSYEQYFNRAYPEAVVRMVDPDRKNYPISGTMLREMWNDNNEWKKYI